MLHGGRLTATHVLSEKFVGGRGTMLHGGRLTATHVLSEKVGGGGGAQCYMAAG